MTKILMIGAALSSVLVLTACNKSADSETNPAATNNTTTDTTATSSTAPVTQPTTTTATAAPDAAHTAETSLDWNGKYEGTLPCADCPGIKTVLTLNLDKTYTLEETYLEREVKPSISKGTFNFDNKNTSIIVLDGAGQQRQYFIGEGFADARAMDGSAIDGPLKAHYKLKKVG